MKKFNFVYITTNLINGKQYVGDHSCDNIDEDVYIGSGNLFELKKKEYGVENFKREILEFFDTKEAAFNAQEKYIKQYNTLVPNGYNISPTGGIFRLGGGLHSLQTRKKMSESAKKSFTQEKRDSISNSNRRRIITAKTKNKIRNTLKERKVPKETSLKISNALKGKPVKINTIIIECEYCHKLSNLGNNNRWHGKNCKYKNIK